MTAGEGRLDALFDAARDLPADARDAALVRAGATPAERDDVLSLLASHDRAGDFLLASPAAAPSRDAHGTADADEVPGYVLLERIGEGGFGEVHRAEQRQPVRRIVALKLLKPWMDTPEVVRRFEGERQALALMDHPHIARVYDAGLSRRGRPFVAMEYSPGRPITEAADAHGLDLRARLALFLDVCDAVHHAHTKGIIHRDIKPANVLVDVREGRLVPKVIDFGIAKAVQGSLLGASLMTSVGQLVGTLESMSPEQAAGDGRDVDTRTDVYALGVLLYELVTGELPFPSERLRRSSLAEAQRLLVEVDPPRPSTRVLHVGAGDARGSARATHAARERARRLRGDLDWITMKALEKRRDDRYPSVSELALDVRRHLDGLPVSAGRPGTAYRMRKFVRRHRFAVAAAAAVLLAVGAGLIATSLALVRAIDAERAAESRRLAAVDAAEHARRAAAAATHARAQAEASRDAALAARTDLERAHAGARSEARKSYAVVDFLMACLVDPAFHVADGAPTVRQLVDHAAARVQDAYGDDPDVEALLRRTLGLLYLSLDADDAAETQFARAVELLREQRDVAPDARDVLALAGQLQVPRGLAARAEDLTRRVLQSAREDGPAVDPGRLLSTADDYALLLTRHGSWQESEQLHRELLETRRATLGPDDPRTRMAQGNLAAALQMQGRPDEAARLLGELVPSDEALADPEADVDFLGPMLASLATALSEAGRAEEAEVRARQAVALFDARRAADDPARLTALVALADVLQRRGALDEAESILRDVLAARLAVDGEDAVTTLSARSALGLLLLARLDFADSALHLRHAADGARRQLGDGHWYTGALRGDLGTCQIGLEHYDDAILELSAAFESLRPVFGMQDARTQAVWNNLLFACEAAGRVDEATDLRQRFAGR